MWLRFNPKFQPCLRLNLRRRVSKFPVLRRREIKQLLPEERRKKIVELRAELTTVRTAVKSGGTVENPARIRELRRTIAKLLTVKNTIPNTGE
ncbi:50S ribosomal protein L29 [Candidatus Bathyarchaeota archaeon]|nr:MAG: 50S ribosomal protein L29 [Candidatus Bathyarchaeota archaeon]